MLSLKLSFFDDIAELSTIALSFTPTKLVPLGI